MARDSEIIAVFKAIRNRSGYTARQLEDKPPYRDAHPMGALSQRAAIRSCGGLGETALPLHCDLRPVISAHSIPAIAPIPDTP